MKNLTKGIFVGITVLGVVILKSLANQENEKFSSRWFELASDDDLEIEREKIRQEYCTPERDYSRDYILERLLRRFDAEKSKRDWDGSSDYKYPKHREHGYYLPNDED